MEDRFDNRRYHNTDTFRVTSTAGAVQIKNERGEVTLQKVKVERYISGKRPSYAKKQSDLVISDNNDSDEDNFVSHRDIKGVKQNVVIRDQTVATSSNDETEDFQMSEHEISFDNTETFTSPSRSEKNIIEDTVQDITDIDDPRLKRLMAIKRETCNGNTVDSANKALEHANNNPETPLEERHKTDGTK